MLFRSAGIGRAGARGQREDAETAGQDRDEASHRGQEPRGNGAVDRTVGAIGAFLAPDRSAPAFVAEAGVLEQELGRGLTELVGADHLAAGELELAGRPVEDDHQSFAGAAVAR